MSEGEVQINPPNKVVKENVFPQYAEGSDTPGVRRILEKGRALAKKSILRTYKDNASAIVEPPPPKTWEDQSAPKPEPEWLVKGVRAKMEHGLPRPDALRRVRQELMDNLKVTPKKDREAIVLAGRARDEIAQQFMANQQEVRVDMGELGEQMARFVVLTPPDADKKAQADTKPPIFLIPGISNDLESMGMLPQEAAMDRNVAMVGFPESWHGDVTNAFGEAAEKSPSYEPHVAFFKGAIKSILERPDIKAKLGDTSAIELWGYSAGAAMVTEMLTDPEIQSMVADAAIIAPPNNVELEELHIPGTKIAIPDPRAMIHEYAQIFRPKNLNDAPKLTVNHRATVEYTDESRARHLRTYNALREKVEKPNEWWKKDLKVREGGKITVISYDDDQLTKSYKVVDEIRQNPNLNVVELSGAHVSPRSRPREVIDAISESI